MKLENQVWFNWANNPFAGSADPIWQVPGYCFSSAYLVLLGGDNLSTPIERPIWIVWDNQIGALDADGEVSLMLATTSCDDYGYTDGRPIEGYESFRSIAEVPINVTVNGIAHSWYQLSENEVGNILNAPFKYGIKLHVRMKGSGITRPRWYSSRLFVRY